MARDDNPTKGMRHIGSRLPALHVPHSPLSRIQERLVSMPAQTEDTETVLYQHSVLCQTCMPYRDPGDEVRIWQRRNGIIRLELQAGRLLDPNLDDFVNLGLPFGPKPRLALFHLNAEALRTQSPHIELDDSLTAFVKRTLGLDAGGRTIRTVREQLNRLAAADFRLGASENGRAITINGTVIEGLELWTPRDSRQRVLWPTHVQFSARYFDSLMQHAVPLNEDAVSRLSHSAMGLDIYTWLAQRLHRVDPRKPTLVPWAMLKEQFGQGYDRMDNFKRVFQTTLQQVSAVYREARFHIDGTGMRLSHSRPPVQRRLWTLR
jgi:Plasmid encoded RepA protein